MLFSVGSRQQVSIFSHDSLVTRRCDPSVSFRRFIVSEDEFRAHLSTTKNCLEETLRIVLW
jgi:hypothetical protein